MNKQNLNPALVSAALLLACFFTITPTYSQMAQLDAESQAALYPSRTNYVITRNGKKVGLHTVSFAQTENTLTVDVESNITITVLKVPVFRFNYTAQEIWQSGQLVRVKARTDRGGDITTAEFDSAVTDAVKHSSNHWNSAVLNAASVFNTLTGNISQVSIELKGTEQLQANGETVSANHYQYTGDIQADVWYDSEQRWVKLQFKGDDGSNIVYTANPLIINP